MNVLIACEFSGVVRRAFAKRGHRVFSCDLLPADDGEVANHYQGDVLDILDIEPGWDLIIAHPPCTYLSLAGNKHYANRPDLYEPAAEFARMFMDYAPKVCVENPVGRLSRLWRKPDQIIQPWQFGHEATKTTCLWLKDLPLLEPTRIVDKGERHITKSGRSLPKWYNIPPSNPDRAKLRSVTFQGIADAMADQWGG